MARLSRPPSRRAQTAQPPRPQFHFLDQGTALLRIYDPTQYEAGPTTFRPFGPLLRFDHHPGVGRAMKRQPCLDPARGILYAAHTLSCCMVESFGDASIGLGERCVARIEVTRPLKLLDLVEEAMAAGTIAAIAATEHHYKAQEWSRRFYEDAVYENLDGIAYRGAHNGEICLALYERARDGLRSELDDSLRLDAPKLRNTLLDIAMRHHMKFDSF